MKELILNKAEEQELKEMQEAYTKLAKEKRALQTKIGLYINSRTVDITTINSTNQYIERDLQLVYDFIKENGKKTTRELCDFLNKTCVNKFKRWNVNNLSNVKLDSGMFHGVMTRYMKEKFIKEDNKYWNIK